MEYDRDLVSEEMRGRLKEWDFYAISGPDFYVDLTLADIAWAAFAGVMFVDYRTGEMRTNLCLGFDEDVVDLPADPYESTTFDRNDCHVSITVGEDSRTLHFDFPDSPFFSPLRGDIIIEDDPSEESLATAFPFHRMDLFFYTNKIVALPASGTVEADGVVYAFPPCDSIAVLDWGRGVWPEEFEWGWAVAAGMVDGTKFGFNIGFGDEDGLRGTASSLVYDGVLHKLGEIEWEYDEDDIMASWPFCSDDGRFDAILKPTYDQSGTLNLLVCYTRVIKVHGRVSGSVVLDDGTVVSFSDVMGFAAHTFQKW